MIASRVEKSPSVEEALRRIAPTGIVARGASTNGYVPAAPPAQPGPRELTPDEYIAAARAADDHPARLEREIPEFVPVTVEDERALGERRRQPAPPTAQDSTVEIEALLAAIRETGEEPLRRLAVMAISAERDAILASARSEAKLLVAEAEARRKTILAKADAKAEIMVSRAEARAATTVAYAEARAEALALQAPQTTTVKKKRKQR